MNYNAAEKSNYLYLYDLPKDSASSISLATYLKEKTDIVLTRIPQIRRDLNRPFYSAIITIPEEEKFRRACTELRYFELKPGKHSRALPYDNDLLGSNPLRIVDHNIFVRKIPAEMTPKELEEHFSKYGPIKSLKISLNSDHSSRRYGFVCFQDSTSAAAALKADENAEVNQVIKYKPRDKREFRKMFNNIYAKNFPEEFEEADARKVFEAHGRIERMLFEKNDKGNFAFVCYAPEDPSDREYGPKCAMEAVQALHNAEVVGGKQLPEGKKFYVKEALKKSEREAERKRETIKYKSSKKRCNLYVKGFPENITEQELRDLFSPFGEIESLKLHPPADQKKLYAFVCFKKPDEASTAKEKLHQQSFKDKALIINHYEIKEVREIQNEQNKDKQDFQTFRAQNASSGQWSDLDKQEELQFYLKMILEQMPFMLRGQTSNMRGNTQHRGNYNRQGGNQRQHGGPRQHGANYGQNRMMGNQSAQAMAMGNMAAIQGQVPAAQLQQMQQMQAQQMQAQALAQQQAQAQAQQAQMTIDQEYLVTCHKILPAVVDENPNYREQVGTVLYEFVGQLVGSEKAPKITGMLIDLPIAEVQHILQDWTLFNTRLQQANEILEGQPAQAK